MNAADTDRLTTTVRVHRYTWPDGAAIIVQRGAFADLWMNADSVTGRYVWGAWGAWGGDFRRWILETAENDPHYAASKLSYGLPDKFSPEATDRSMREWILHGRRDGDLDKDRARRLYDDWREFINDGYDAGTVVGWAQEHDIEDSYEILRYERHGLALFLQHMPHLATALRADLAREENPTCRVQARCAVHGCGVPARCDRERRAGE